MATLELSCDKAAGDVAASRQGAPARSASALKLGGGDPTSSFKTGLPEALERMAT